MVCGISFSLTTWISFDVVYSVISFSLVNGLVLAWLLGLVLYIFGLHSISMVSCHVVRLVLTGLLNVVLIFLVNVNFESIVVKWTMIVCIERNPMSTSSSGKSWRRRRRRGRSWRKRRRGRSWGSRRRRRKRRKKFIGGKDAFVHKDQIKK